MSELEILRRAVLPEVLLSADVAVTLQIPESEAKRLIEAGEFGKWFRVGDTLAVLRPIFLAALKKRGANSR